MLACHTLKKGNSSPLVFLHGFLGSALDWKAVCDFLPDCLCYGIDLPGHGKSPFTPDFFSEMPLFNTPVHLIGYSMGGRLALQYATRFPDRIASLILLSTHPGLETEKEKQERIAADKIWTHLIKTDLDAFLKKWYDQAIFGHFKPDFSMRLQQNPFSLAEALIHYGLGHQNRFDLSHALLAVGERDLKFRQLLPQATLIPNAAHMVHLENPKATAQFIIRSLS